MFRYKLMLAALMMFGMLVGWGMTQGPAGKVKKDAKDPPIKQPAEPDTFKDDLKIVRESGLKGEGPDLLEYFRKKTLKQPDANEIARMVKQLGDDDFATREQTFTALVALGGTKDVLVAIKAGEADPDLEVRKRVADLKHRIETRVEATFQSAAARMLAKLKPEGAADNLMAFLPLAGDPTVVDEICKALGAVAVHNGKVEPVILRSLEDAIAIKRGAAGEALARARVKEEFPNMKKLLKDGDVSVRFRVCMAMMTLQDKDIVPVMIDLLGELSPNQLWPIEEALLRLAGDKGPSVALGNDPIARKACRDAWSKWYAANEKTIDIAKLSQGNVFLGYTLIVQHNNRIGVGGGGNTGEIFELDKDKNVRWKISMPTGYPVDAQIVGAGRVLVAEYQGGKVSERDLKGDVKWEYACGGNPFSVQRLGNGNTFIAMQNRLVEVNRNKDVVWTYQPPNMNFIRARKLPTGEVAFITNIGNNATYTRMETRGPQKINKTFQIATVSMLFGSMEVLPNGHIIVPHYNQQRVVEYDQDGAQVSAINNLQWPNSVARLPNGNTLVTSYQQRQVFEFNGNQQVWNYQTDGPVFVARRR